MSTNATRIRPGVVLVAMTLANAMVLVDQTAVPLAVPDIFVHFGVSAQAGQWVLTANALMLAGLLVFGGRLADMVGRRQIFLLGATIFIVASACAGSAVDMVFLIVVRGVQGVGAALMLPATIAIVAAAFPAETRGRALGTMGGVAAVFAALGPTIGGGLTTVLSWRAVFLVNVPLAVLAIVLTRAGFPRDEVDRSQRQRLDHFGTVLLCLAIITFVLVLAQGRLWGLRSPLTIAAVVVCVTSALWFVRHEKRVHDPLIDFSLFRYRNYRAATISQFVAGFAELGLAALLPVLLVLVFEMSPAMAGLALIPTTLPMIVIAPLGGRWYDRVGGRIPLCTGFLTIAAGTLWMGLAAPMDSYVLLVPGLFIYGVGLALVLTVNDPVTIDMVDEGDDGQASGVSATGEQLGGAVGIALLGTVMASVYLWRRDQIFEERGIHLDDAALDEFRNKLQGAESTGLHPSEFSGTAYDALVAAGSAALRGYAAAFLFVTAMSVVAAIVMWRLVRRPDDRVSSD